MTLSSKSVRVQCNALIYDTRSRKLLQCPAFPPRTLVLAWHGEHAAARSRTHGATAPRPAAEKFPGPTRKLNSAAADGQTMMAMPASKRRKVEHTSSDGEEDDESFASFTASENEEEPEDDGDDSIQLVLEETNGKQPGLQHPPIRKPDRVPQQEVFGKKRPPISARGNGTYTSGTFKGNMLKMQIDELLDQIRPRHGKREMAAEDALHKLKDCIAKLPARGPLPVEEAERQLLIQNKVATPFPNPRPPKDAKYKVEFARPANINVVGSYAVKTASRATNVLEIDMVVTIPSALFQEKDYRDYRYFYKRAYYLACVAAGIRDVHGKDFRLCFRNFHDNSLKPVLVVSPISQAHDPAQNEPTSKWEINIIPCISADVFPQDRLLLNKNCVRNSSSASSNGKDMEQSLSATPFYNASLRSDMLMISYLQVLHSASNGCAAFKDSCLLGSTWLRQRGYGSRIHSGGFGNFEFAVLTAFLLQGGTPGVKSMLSESSSSYQIFKATLQLLAKRDLSKDPMVFGATETTKPSQRGAPIVWDGTRSHSVLYKMTPWSYKLLRHDAGTALSMLEDQNFEPFEATFILRSDSLLSRYDCILTFDAPSLGSNKERTNHYQGEPYQKLYNVLVRGLGERIALLNIIPQWSESWELGSVALSRAGDRKLLLGIMLNPDTANRTVDHGPSAEDKAEAASFRKFWGEKAELRRYRDGSILESLVWSANESGPSVIEQIVRYLIKSHSGNDAEGSISFTRDGFKNQLPQLTGIGAFQPVMDAYKQLESNLRNLYDLPLSVRQIMPADSQLRFASITPARTTQPPLPADVNLQFEGSVRWPDDLEAIQRTKIAFLLKIGGLLQDSVETLTARIGLENEEHGMFNQAFLDVGYDSGTAFRLRIYHDREQTLLERQVKNKALDPRSKEIAAMGLAKHKRDFIKAPAHTQAISRLCSRFPALSGTIRLAKKWFASHLLSNHIADEIIELIVTRSFEQPWPWHTPASVQTGFLRSLFWLSRWDWRAEPLIVDLSGGGELKQADFHVINTTFEAWRKLDPTMSRVAIFAASNFDRDGTTWTDNRPAKVVATRMTALAKAAYAEVEEKQLSLETGVLFSSPLDDFDFVVHLNSQFVGNDSKRRQATKNGLGFKNLELDVMYDLSLAGLNPVKDFADELESLYGSAILFFSGYPERPLIAGLWNPQTAPRAWKVHLAYSTIPKMDTKIDGVQAEMNKEAMLAQIARLGGDMIEKIEVIRT